MVVSLRRFFLLGFFLFLFLLSALAQNPWNGKVVLQGFWWDYWNNNYSNGWCNYIADLAPRLRDMGIDAVWIPPSVKNASTSSVGYAPFDHYDLGDKYQKGSLKTRLGTKDEYLRMIAVLHANGIDVIQDIVLNHMSDAGSTNGSGGSDPSASANNDGNLYKNFRYVSYSTPATNETATNYLARSGRWPANWENFHANSAHNSTSGDWCVPWFGPDICYYSGAYGQSSNATYNPAQYSDYMRINARNWLVWYKKQSGFDGVRLDAAKHFPWWATQDFLWNLKYSASWANGGANMFAVGEVVGSGSDEDTWINNVKTSNGGSEDLVGTFDFGLRSGLYGMISAGDAYNIGSIPGAQQGNRYRTVPFVNNHDTFRPIKDANGNITGWDTGNELAPHIDPNDGRIQAAYAIACAVDGSPQIFFEDLFNIATTSKRYSHLPTNTTDLPVRDAIANIIWCHQKLSFKAGAYLVRWQATNNLIIERSGRAIIGVNNNWNNWQSATIQTNFAPGTQLHDYSGANSSDIWVDGSGKVTIWTPPCNGSNLRRGYTIWGPAGITGGFSPAIRSTTQEWEMANDLGDSHASSLQQGGALPASSTALRTAGKVFDEANKTITVNIFPTNTAKNLTVNIYNNSGSIVKTVKGTGNLTATYTPSAKGFYKVKIKNTYSSNPSQNVFVKVTYTAPQVASTASYPAKYGAEENIGSEESEMLPEKSELYQNYPNPFNPSTTIRYAVAQDGYVSLKLYDLLGKEIATISEGNRTAGEYEVEWNAGVLASGLYFYKLQAGNFVETKKLLLMK